MSGMISVASVKKRLYLVVARYFRFWAHISFRRWHPRVIAVTGSVGKTTMLHLLECQLGSTAHYSHDANSAYGIAFDIVGSKGVTGSKLRWLWLFITIPVRSLFFRHTEPFYVVEIDGERPHETEFLASWLKPEVTLWVSLGRSHASYYDAQVERGDFPTVEEAIAYEFGALPRHTSSLVIYDNSNPLIATQLEGISAQSLSVDTHSLKSYKVWPSATEFTMASGVFSFSYPLPRETWVQIAMLETLCNYLGIAPVHDMSSFTMPPGRSSFFRGINNTSLIDSTYNAHLMSIESMVHMLEEMDAPHKWLVIGDIVEQGKGEANEHIRLGELLAQSDVERIILVGRRTTTYTLPVIEKSNTPVAAFRHVSDAISYIDTTLEGGETILCKGSQYLEAVVEHLLADPRDADKLPRREKSAVRRREKWGIR